MFSRGTSSSSGSGEGTLPLPSDMSARRPCAALLISRSMQQRQAAEQLGRPLFASFGRSVDTWAWNGYLSANYHALQASFNHRAGHGLLLKGAYTFSKAINFTDEDGWTGTINWNWASGVQPKSCSCGI